MITYDFIIEAQDFLVKCWGEDGKHVIEECAKITPYNDTVETFFKEECLACGGNLVGMVLSGIKKNWKNVYRAIPAQMGLHAFVAVYYVLLLCGVDTSEE